MKDKKLTTLFVFHRRFGVLAGEIVFKRSQKTVSNSMGSYRKKSKMPKFRVHLHSLYRYEDSTLVFRVWHFSTGQIVNWMRFKLAGVYL